MGHNKLSQRINNYGHLKGYLSFIPCVKKSIVDNLLSGKIEYNNINKLEQKQTSETTINHFIKIKDTLKNLSNDESNSSELRELALREIQRGQRYIIYNKINSLCYHHDIGTESITQLLNLCKSVYDKHIENVIKKGDTYDYKKIKKIVEFHNKLVNKIGNKEIKLPEYFYEYLMSKNQPIEKIQGIFKKEFNNSIDSFLAELNINYSGGMMGMSHRKTSFLLDDSKTETLKKFISDGTMLFDKSFIMPNNYNNFIQALIENKLIDDEECFNQHINSNNNI